MSYSSWLRSDIIDLFIAIGTILTALITGGLLIVAKKGLRKLLNQEAGKEQLQLMLDFLKKLAEENIPVIDFQKSNLQVLATLYDTSIMEYSEDDINTSFEFYDMYTEGGHHSIAYTYLRDPLLPASVVKKIKKFRDLPTEEFRFKKEDLLVNFWLIGGYVPKVYQPPKWLD